MRAPAAAGRPFAREQPEHAALDLGAARRRLDDHELVVRERLLERVARRARASLTLTIPTEEPRCAGLTNTGRPSRASSASTSLAAAALEALARARPRSRPGGAGRAPSAA